MKSEIKKNLVQLYEQWTEDQATDIQMLPPSGSNREYYRITGKKKTIIGVFNPDKKENQAFISFSKHFSKKGLPVPEIYSENKEKNIYLIQDLGNTTLFDYLSKLRQSDEFPEEIKNIYKKVIKQLISFQTKGGDGLDYKICYPRNSFDKQSMIWDLHYFKYYFLKLAQIPFDEQLLEDDFQKFSHYLLDVPRDYFLYRDFQSRNIMLFNNEPWFIDYQGGRKGALQYDLASLLFDAKADIPQEVRDELFEYYLNELKSQQEVNRELFISHYYSYVLIRVMQAMGAYGFRGFYERKKHFLKSIPYALKNLKIILGRLNLPVELPELFKTLKAVVNSKYIQQIGVDEPTKLNVEINSFSYRRGIPLDKSQNGGGFVFDCRAIHNPGLYEKYKQLTGKDAEVIKFLENKSEIHQFLESVYKIVDMSVEKYLERKFTNLQINFGCTGGRHRSVFSAENLTKHLREKYNINVILRHVEMEIEGV